MNRYKVPFYFVLYLVVLVELLLVIIERDTTELQLKARLAEYATIQDSVISLYSLPILLSVQEETEWLISQRDSAHVLVTVSNLQTPEERADVQYYIRPNEEINNGFYRVTTDKKTGNGNFYFNTRNSGSYSFNVFCRLKRQLPRYLPRVIIEGIHQKIGNEYFSSSDTVTFKVKAKHLQQNYDKPGRG